MGRNAKMRPTAAHSIDKVFAAVTRVTSLLRR
jgi:hypothetical protein